MCLCSLGTCFARGICRFRALIPFAIALTVLFVLNDPEVIDELHISHKFQAEELPYFKARSSGPIEPLVPDGAKYVYGLGTLFLITISAVSVWNNRSETGHSELLVEVKKDILRMRNDKLSYCVNFQSRTFTLGQEALFAWYDFLNDVAVLLTQKFPKKFLMVLWGFFIVLQIVPYTWLVLTVRAPRSWYLPCVPKKLGTPKCFLDIVVAIVNAATGFSQSFTDCFGGQLGSCWASSLLGKIGALFYGLIGGILYVVVLLLVWVLALAAAIVVAALCVVIWCPFLVPEMIYRFPRYLYGFSLYVTKMLSFPLLPVTYDFFEAWQWERTSDDSETEEDKREPLVSVKTRQRELEETRQKELEAFQQRAKQDINEYDEEVLKLPWSDMYHQGVSIGDFWTMYFGEIFFENLGQFIVVILISGFGHMWTKVLVVSLITTGLGFVWNILKYVYWLIIRPINGGCCFGPCAGDRESDMKQKKHFYGWNCMTFKHNLIAMHKYYYTMHSHEEADKANQQITEKVV